MKKNNKKGGEAIASGGFGCVFSPALKCKNKKRNPKNISKLMIKKHALSEYNEIINLRKKLDKIPNYKKYFLINDSYLCEPEKLTQDDLKNFGNKCKALPKDNINAKNINNSLDKLNILNMPYGGLPVDEFIQNNVTYLNLIELNKTLIDLLNNGIIPMNKKYIFHSDIKDSNILVEEQNIHARLIDWGLSEEYIPFKNSPFPNNWRNRPLQFNVPFSNILFSEDFVNKYTVYLEKGGEINVIGLKPFVLDYIHYWLHKRGEGHYKYINYIFYMLFSHDFENVDNEEVKTRLIETEFTLLYISNYLIQILIHFTKFRENGTLDLRVYLDNVFIHIIDVWGWVISYLPIFETLFENYKKLDENQFELFKELKELFLKHLYRPHIEPININELNKDFGKLNSIFRSIFTNKTKDLKTEYKSSLGNKTTSPIFIKTSKNKRSLFKKNRTKRNKYLLFLPKK